MHDYFSDFMRTKYNVFIAYCVSRGQNREDADEIVAEAFVRLWKKWDERSKEDERRNMKWMYNAIEYVIKEYNREKPDCIIEDIDDYIDVLPAQNSADDEVRYTEFVNLIAQHLSDTDRELFMSAYIQQLTYSEIRERFHVNDQTLRTRISRLKDRIAKILESNK